MQSRKRSMKPCRIFSQKKKDTFEAEAKTAVAAVHGLRTAPASCSSVCAYAFGEPHADLSCTSELWCRKVSIPMFLPS